LNGATGFFLAANCNPGFVKEANGRVMTANAVEATRRRNLRASTVMRIATDAANRKAASKKMKAYTNQIREG
jgi:hypothetical protein